MTYKKGFFQTVMAFIHVSFLFAPLYVFAGCMGGLEGKDLVHISLFGIFTIVPVIISYIMLRYVKNLFLYIAIAFGLTVMFSKFAYNYSQISFNLSGLMSVLTFVICAAIFVIRNHSKVAHNQLKADFMAVHENEEFMLEPWEVETFLSKPSPFHWIWFGFLYGISIIQKYHPVLEVLFFILVADVIIIFVTRYQESFFGYLKMNNRVASLPVTSMRKVHGQIFVVGLILLGLFMMPAIIYHQEPLEHVKPPKHALIQIHDEPQGDPDQPMVHEKETEILEMLNEDDKIVAPEWVRNLLIGFVCLVAIAGIAFVVMSFIRSIMDMARDYGIEDEDEVIYLKDESGDDAKRSKRSTLGEILSERAKIRRQYRRAIRKGTKGEPKRSATPAELEAEADFMSKAENEGLHEKYEKARYDR